MEEKGKRWGKDGEERVSGEKGEIVKW